MGRDALVVARYSDRVEAEAAALVVSGRVKVQWTLPDQERATGGSPDAGLVTYHLGEHWFAVSSDRGRWPTIRRVIDAVRASGPLAVAYIPDSLSWEGFAELEGSVVTDDWLETIDSEWVAAVLTRWLPNYQHEC